MGMVSGWLGLGALPSTGCTVGERARGALTPQRPRRVVEVWIYHVYNRFGWGIKKRLEDREFRAAHELVGRRLAERVSSPIV